MVRVVTSSRSASSVLVQCRRDCSSASNLSSLVGVSLMSRSCAVSRNGSFLDCSYVGGVRTSPSRQEDDTSRRTPMNDEIRPFRIEIPQTEVDHLHDRLATARWPGELP